MSDEPQYKLEVLNVIRSPQGYAIVPIHYSHDPEKGYEWREKEIKRYQSESDVDWERKWKLEQEIDFTEVSGAPAYPAYGLHNELKGILCNPALPLCLMMDFNVDPMIWEIGQIRHDNLYVFDEIVMSPSTGIDNMVREFRNRYPNHPHELWIYGDSAGTHKSAQTGTTDYALVNLALRGYSSPVRMHVPFKAPYEIDRVNAVNRRLKGQDGEVHIFIDPDKCKELIKDLKEVQKGPDSHIVKVRDRNKAYFYRTHASDALGYLIAREWPVVNELIEQQRKAKSRRKPRKYGRVLGSL